MVCTVVLVSLLRVGPFPRYRRFRFTHDNDENDRLILRHGKQSTTKSRLCDSRHQRQTRKGNPQSTKSFYYSRSQETRKCKCCCCICSTRGDIDAESLHLHAHDKPYWWYQPQHDTQQRPTIDTHSLFRTINNRKNTAITSSKQKHTEPLINGKQQELFDSIRRYRP